MTNPPHLRSDAVERRERLVRVASHLFVDEGLDVPMERIAREAEVGVGTLYRRFPDRTTLLVAVVADSLGRVRDRMRATLESGGRVWDGFLASFDNPDHTAIGLRGRLAQSPAVAVVVQRDPDVQRVQHEVADVLDALVAAAQAEGSMRTDVGTGDVAMLLSLVGRRWLPAGADDAVRARLRRLVLDTLATGSTDPLPGAPVSIAELWGTDA